MGSYSPELRVALAIERGIKFDPEDQHIIEEKSWVVGSHGYACTTYQLDDGTKEGVLLHRRITNCPNGFVVDHINKDKLDNRRCNLRIVSQSDNMKVSDLGSVVGISYTTRNDRYKLVLNIGTYKEQEEAEAEGENILKILRNAGYQFPFERRLNVTQE